LTIDLVNKGVAG